MTRDEVIKGLACCMSKITCTGCPLENTDPDNDCNLRLMSDAIALLKDDSSDLVNGIQTMREICWCHACVDCPAFTEKEPDATWCGKQCVFFPDHAEMSPQEVAEIVWAYQAKKRKEEEEDA